MGMSNDSPYLLPRGCGSEADQRRATCLDLFTMTDNDLLREQGRLEAFILSDDPALGSTIFVPRLGLPSVADWATNRCLVIDGLLCSRGFVGNLVFVRGHARLPRGRQAAAVACDASLDGVPAPLGGTVATDYREALYASD